MMALGAGYDKVADRIQAELQEEKYLSPTTLHMLSDICDQLGLGAPDRTILDVKELCRRLISEKNLVAEQALLFRREFQGLGYADARSNQNARNEPLWTFYEKNSWLISISPLQDEQQKLLVAVDAPEIIALLRDDKMLSGTFPVGFEVVGDIDPRGESLGPYYRSVEVTYNESDIESYTRHFNAQPTLYWLVLLLILGMTFFAAYLFWRDVRRQINVARMRSQFVSSVSHELKTPLTAIQLFAETLQLNRLMDKETESEYLDTIINESRRLARLLNNVLDFARIEKGKRIYKKERVSLYEIIQSAARVVEYAFSQRGFRLHIDLGKGVPDVEADRDAIEQALINLLHNAMKYSAKSRDIDLLLTRENGHAVIQVVDRGIGIEPAEQTLIFKRFYRVLTDENKNIVGTGLGLFLVDHIVKAHGGRVEVESTMGEGSVFSVYLPLMSGS
jgi:anti-sigma regulatory factor (Ser/Thr protein kinase)